MNGFLLWVAQGFYSGRIPFAPGTFGSCVGLAWAAVLLAFGLWGYCLGAVLGALVSIRVCGQAERIIGQTDPGSVVLDEIVAMPFCFAAWIGMHLAKTGQFPSPSDLFITQTWWLTLATFAAFRFFDITKPWPVKQSQRLPGGWGVTIDDLLAAGYVNLLVLVGAALRAF
ncbi:MAG: phosphatidylglycerophosphatase A [Verrucomicrobiota bacterium]